MRKAVFLLNSWALRVTMGHDFHHGQAFSRSYNSNWPNSLSNDNSMAIGYLPWRPDAVNRYGYYCLRIVHSLLIL